MTQHLHFAEAAILQDLNTYISRGRRINEQGIRLQALGKVLAAWLPVMTPSTLTSRIPAVLGLRTMALAEESEADITVELSSVTERLARMNPVETTLALPPSRINAPWAAVTPPRSGWALRGTMRDADLRQVAQEGIAEVAEAVPQTAGPHVVEQVREHVWSLPLEHRMPKGAAFGALSMGFLQDGEDATSTIHTHGKWVRLTSAGGFILSRAS